MFTVWRSYYCRVQVVMPPAQVTQSSYQTHDGLSSAPARLVVRHPPSEPRIYTDGRTFASEVISIYKYLQDKDMKNICPRQVSVSLVAGREQVLTCESRGGNPAPVLSWWLGDTQLDSEQVGGSGRVEDLDTCGCGDL